MLRRLSSESFKLFSWLSIIFQRPLVIEHGLVIGLYNDFKQSWLYAFHIERSFCHALLFSLYFCLRIQPSLPASHRSQANCIKATVNKIVEFNESCLLCSYVVQFSFHALMIHRDSFVHTGTKKGFPDSHTQLWKRLPTSIAPAR